MKEEIKPPTLSRQIVKTGRDLDAEVAERVMNIECNCARTPDGSIWCRRHGKGKTVGAPFFSSDIERAWLVVQRFQQRGYLVSVNASDEGGFWCCMYPPQGDMVETAIEISAPLAICRAALAAIDSQ